ncbi:MAG: hypothetical protein ACFFF4_16705 [Candidatus Thorarchaeota archaeon]
MNEEMPENEDNAADMSDAIVDAVNRDKEDSDDALSKRERKVEQTKEAERIRKAKELKKQLRKRELGILRYRWPAAILIISGVFSLLNQFLAIWIQDALDPAYGFNTYMEAFFFNGNVFFLFPIFSGILLILIGYFAYARPRATYWSLAPAMMMAMAGAFPYLLIDIVSGFVDIQATMVPIQMIFVAVLCLLAIAMREKE